MASPTAGKDGTKRSATLPFWFFASANIDGLGAGIDVKDRRVLSERAPNIEYEEMSQWANSL
jgi:hypothetical protein